MCMTLVCVPVAQVVKNFVEEGGGKEGKEGGRKRGRERVVCVLRKEKVRCKYS